MRPARALTVAAAAAAVLATTVTGPATAVTTTAEPAAGTVPTTGGHQRIPLVTGDRVLVAPGGRVVGFEPAAGRERVPVRIQRTGDRTLLLPADAERLIAEGRLDERLFDVVGLADPALRRSHGDGLKLIVQYAGAAAPARSGLRAAGTTKVRRSLPTLNAEAVRTSPADAARVWKALTDRRRDGARATASGIARVWLDGVRRASLDRSVPQIGADRVRQAGYDGTGVRIAVLDTGVDRTHPDLASRVKAERNFSDSPDTADRVGHGTHVASTAAGTGAASGGRLAGVAPGAELISGKVLGDEGYGEDSAIVAGMEWAAAEGADIVNLSLGSPDSPGTDPLEAAVDRLSAERGVLFAVAAGNDGTAGASTLGSPGTADAALTVGAVDKEDRLAPFSSTGPRLDDGAVKPDVTAPGVAVTAAAAPGSALDTRPGIPHPTPGYLSLDGTSMATPHVAGAAALLKQRHPRWRSVELKGALTASTEGGPYTAYQQGTGRIRVDRALSQSVIADPVSLTFGTARWPHADDEPVTRKVGYRNLGTTDVTLELSVAGVDPAGRPAPEGFFRLGADRVTVPAGGRAEVALTADTRVGDADGTFTGYVTAAAPGQSVRTAATAVREAESYDLTLRALDRDGAEAAHYTHTLVGVDGPAKGFGTRIDSVPGAQTVRVPKGSYMLDTAVYRDPSDLAAGSDWISRPKLEVTRATRITADARTTKPVDLTVPGIARADFGGSYYERATPAGRVGNGWVLRGFTGFRTAHAGPAVTDGSLLQTWDAHFLKGATAQYAVAFGGAVRKLATGYARHVKRSGLAVLKVSAGASAAGKTVFTAPFPQLPGAPLGNGYAAPMAAPSTRTFYLSTADGVRWTTRSDQYGAPGEHGFPVFDSSHETVVPQRYEAGRTYRETFNTAVFGPLLTTGRGVFRTAPDPETGEQHLVASVPLLADGRGHPGFSTFTKVRSVLYRDGVEVAENDDPLSGYVPFTVGAGEAAYRLTAVVERSAEVAGTASRVEASFSFRSGPVTDTTALPVSTVRFAVPVDLASGAPAGRTVRVPVTVQGAAADGNLGSLVVSVSRDRGKTWQRLTVKDGAVSVRNPAAGESLSFRARVTDGQGNTSAVTIRDAYLGR